MIFISKTNQKLGLHTFYLTPKILTEYYFLSQYNYIAEIITGICVCRVEVTALVVSQNCSLLALMAEINNPPIISTRFFFNIYRVNFQPSHMCFSYSECARANRKIFGI